MSDINDQATTPNDAPAPAETDQVSDDALDAVSGGMLRDAEHKEEALRDILRR